MNTTKEPIENIIWSWTPSEKQRAYCEEKEILTDIAEEYRIAKIDDRYLGGVIIYGKYHNEWVANPNERYVIAELLKQLNIIKG